MLLVSRSDRLLGARAGGGHRGSYPVRTDRGGRADRQHARRDRGGLQPANALHHQRPHHQLGHCRLALHPLLRALHW